MLITEKIADGYLAVKCNYSADYVSRLRRIPGARFNPDQKRWIIPIGAFDYFEDDFRGEIIYKTPRWVILNEQPPDYSNMYKIDNSITVPQMLINPYDYQRYGMRFMIDRLKNTGFVINADDVGLGKTIQATGTMYWLFKNHMIKRVLIVCKKSLKRQWVSEIGKFTDIPKRVVTAFTEGTKKKREKLYEEFNKRPWGVLVTNYHTVMNDHDKLEKMNFDLVIIDEAHCVKARTGEMNNAIGKVAQKAKYIVFLTGTPIMSKPDDIYGVIQIADKKYFGKWSDFQKRYIKYENGGRFVKTVGYRNLDELRDLVQNIVIRRTEFEVALELPQTIIKKIECEIDNTQDALQEQLRADRAQYTAQLDKLNQKAVKTPQDTDKIQMLNGMLKGLGAAFQAVADDPRLMALSKSKAMQQKYAPLVPASYKASGKTEALLELVEEIVENNNKVIIFTKFERATRLLKQDIEKALKYNVVLYTGDVDDDQREINIDLFKNTADHNILIGTDAMAEGLNLQVCNHVINYDLADTPAIMTQRAGRARRIGSKYSTVYVYNLITLESKDVERLENLERASNLFDGLVGVNEAQSEAIKQAIAKEA